MKEEGSLTGYEIQNQRSCVSNSHPLTSDDVDYLHVVIPAIALCLESVGQDVSGNFNACSVTP